MTHDYKAALDGIDWKFNDGSFTKTEKDTIRHALQLAQEADELHEMLADERTENIKQFALIEALRRDNEKLKAAVNILEQKLRDVNKAHDRAEAKLDKAKDEYNIGEYIKTGAAKDYDGLLVQFNAMKSLLNSQGKRLSFYSIKDYSLSEKKLKYLSDCIESEKSMNAQLTLEAEKLSSVVNELIEVIEKGVYVPEENAGVVYRSLDRARTTLEEI